MRNSEYSCNAKDRDPERRHEDRSPGLRGGRGGGARGGTRGRTSGSTLPGGSGALEGGRGPRTSLGPSQLFGSGLLLRAFGRPLRSATALGGRTGRPLGGVVAEVEERVYGHHHDK